MPNIGVLIYYIATSRYPFSGSNTYTTLENIQKTEPNLQLIANEHLRELVASMLVKNPQLRAGI